MNLRYILYISLILLTLGCKSEGEKPTSVANETSQKQKATTKPTKAKTNRTSYNYEHVRTGDMKWLTIEEGINIERPSSKKYLIDIYTEWCSWCKVMDKKTFTDPEVQKYLEENFNIVKFNAESDIDVRFKDMIYYWKEDGRKGIHTLAAKFMEGQISYPTMVFLDENMQPLRISRGYKNAKQTIQELEIVTRS